MSHVKKCDKIPTKNLHVVTSKGMKIGNYNPLMSKIKNKDDYPNPIKQKQVYTDASNMFQEFGRQEEIDHSRQYISQEIINLVHNDKSITQFIDMLHNIKNKHNIEKQTKNTCSLNKKDKSDADPLINLEIEGYHFR